jgi:hypothetical protein
MERSEVTAQYVSCHPSHNLAPFDFIDNFHHHRVIITEVKFCLLVVKGEKQMAVETMNGNIKQSSLLNRFLKAKPEFKSYKIELAADLHERLDKLMNKTGMTKEAVNEAMNYAVRKLVTQLEREARQSGK